MTDECYWHKRFKSITLLVEKRIESHQAAIVELLSTTLVWGWRRKLCIIQQELAFMKALRAELYSYHHYTRGCKHEYPNDPMAF